MFQTTITKQINVYGKRSRRFVQVSDENNPAGVHLESFKLERKGSGSPVRRFPRPHIARTSTSPLLLSRSPVSKTYAHTKKSRPKLKGSNQPKPQAINRRPFSDVMNSPIARRIASNHLSKSRSKFDQRPIESTTVISSDDEAESSKLFPRKPLAKRVRRIVDSDYEPDEDCSEEEPKIVSPRIPRRRRRIVESDDGEDEEVSNQLVIDLTLEDSPPIAKTQSTRPGIIGLQPRSRKASGSGNLFNVSHPNRATSKKRVSSTPVLTRHKPTNTKALIQPFEDLTLNDTPPPRTKPISRIVSTPAGEFSPVKTRMQRKVSHLLKVSPLRDSALSPSRDHRAKAYAKTQKHSPLRSSLLPVWEEKRKETKIIEVKAAPPKSQAPVVPVAPSRAPQSFAQLLQPLLAECRQTDVMDFDFFISTFPSDEIFESERPVTFHSKIGEATYSEVFGCGSMVLKIVPLRNPEKAGFEREIAEEDMPTQSEIAEVEREIITTRALGEFSSGFVKLVRANVVKGRYPRKLLSLWDKFDRQRGSENVRPSCFEDEQHYSIIVLPNGGPDLENYDFKKSKVSSKRPWWKACSIFWQIVAALERAEDLVGFEHRDLHWGQILVKEGDHLDHLVQEGENLADPKAAGVTVTIIDLGLARMDDAGDDTKQRWTEFDPEIFEGKGDYQYDIYRMMRAHNGGEWGSYRPLTNVMWLHYILLKLLKAKRLREPAQSRVRGSASYTSETRSERESHEILTEMEKLLERTLKTRTCRTEDPLRSAGDVWRLGLKKGWVKPNL